MEVEKGNAYDDDSIIDELTKDEVCSTSSLIKHRDNDPVSSSPAGKSGFNINTAIRSRMASQGWVDHLLPTNQERQAKRRSRAIDQSIKEDEIRLRREYKIMVLGSNLWGHIANTLRKVQAQDTDANIEPNVQNSIAEVRVPIRGNFTAHLFNVPRRIPNRERRRWVPLVLEMICAMLFVVDLDTYYESLLGDPNVTQMQESIVLFDSIVNSRRLAKATPILAFNRVKIFKDKLAQQPFKNCFPDYAAGDDDVEAVVEYLLGRFNQ